LALPLLGLVHQADQGSFFVRELSKTFPSTSVDSILPAVRAIQDNATTLGIVGGAFLLWSSLSFFSVLESAFNIVYGRPNRGFLHGKALATLMMVASLVTLFAAVVVGSVGAGVLGRHVPGFEGNATTAWVTATVASLVGVFLFLASAYYVLTNATVSLREVLPGATTAAILVELTLQGQRAFLRVTPEHPMRPRRFCSPSSRATSASAWDSGGAQRADSTPGPPPSASHSIPESSPSTHTSRGARARPCSAFSRAFASYVAPSSGG